MFPRDLLDVAVHPPPLPKGCNRSPAARRRLQRGIGISSVFFLLACAFVEKAASDEQGEELLQKLLSEVGSHHRRQLQVSSNELGASVKARAGHRELTGRLLGLDVPDQANDLQALKTQGKHGGAHASEKWPLVRKDKEAREAEGVDEERQREQEQCGTGVWQQEYVALHRWIRSGEAPAPRRRYLTFTCTPGLCGGIGDLLIGLASSFVIAFVQSRALVIDYTWMETAFEPQGVDWRLSPEVPLLPARPAPKDEAMRRGLRAGSVVYLNMHNRDLPEDVAGYFDSLVTAGNIRLLLNRGILVELMGGSSPAARMWRAALEAKGLRLDSAFGCALRLLIKVKPDLWEVVRPTMDRIGCEAPGTRPAGDGAGGGRGGFRVAIGIHVRTSDAVSWEVEKVGEKPKLRRENVRAEMRGARKLFDCAEKLQGALYAPGTPTSWLLFSSSRALKQAASTEFGEKVVVTDVVPRHIELKGSDDDRAAAFRTTVAEWALLSRCCSLFVFTESGFSKTAALFSLRPHSIFMFARWADSWRDHSWVDKCDPDEPTPFRVLGNATRWSGI